MIDITGAGDHVLNVDAKNRRIKEPCSRRVKESLSWKIPKNMHKDLVAYAVGQINIRRMDDDQDDEQNEDKKEPIEYVCARQCTGETTQYLFAAKMEKLTEKDPKRLAMNKKADVSEIKLLYREELHALEARGQKGARESFIHSRKNSGEQRTR